MAIEQKKISDVIKRLQEVMKQHGNLPCVYACDEEGNSYSHVYYDATPGTFDDGDFDVDSNNINAVCIN